MAQTGTIQGTLTDSTTKEVVIDATIVIEGTELGANSDIDGTFSITVKPGTYNLRITGIGYEKQYVRNIVVKSGETTEVNPKMRTVKGHQDIEVVVVASKITNTDAAVVEEMKNAVTVASGISAEQIGKSQDRDASEAVRRIAGVTVIDSRFVMVRGLSERYNAVMLNNALTPSFEQDVKAFSFDVIPSQMIDRVLVYKAPAPELSGEFAGGAIKIFTTGIPLRNSFNVGFSSSYRQNTTFKDFYRPVRGKYDWLSYNDDTYKHPKDVPPDFSETDKYDNIKVGKLFRNDTWLPVHTNASPDSRFNLNFTRKISLKNNVTIGVISAMSYTSVRTYFKGLRQMVLPYNDPSLINNTPQYNYKEDLYTQNARLGALQNFAIRIGANHNIEFKNLYNHQGGAQYQVLTGNDQGIGGDYYKRYMLYNTYRGLYSSQLSGTHTLSDNTELDWTTGYSKATRDEPDVKRYMQYTPSEQTPYRFTLVTGSNVQFFGRLYGKTNEDVKMTSANLQHTFVKNKKAAMRPQLKTGFYLEEKKRQYQLKVYGYQAEQPKPDGSGNYNETNIDNWTLQDLNKPESWNNYNGLVITRGWNSGTSYSATNSLIAYYAGLNLPYKEKFNVYSGVRVENNTQTVTKSTHIVSVLPSVNSTYSFSNKLQLRAAYGKTVNRPEFREIANMVFYDFFFFRAIAGNPNLKTPNIHNAEMRLEFYPRFGEVLSVGVFGKRFINPIERILVPTSGGASYVTYQNAGSATSLGVEAEVKKGLDSLITIGGRDPLKHISFSMNAALIRSRVHFDSVNILTVQERPMMGQSPYVVNAGLTYNNEPLRLLVYLSYNVIGKRIFVADNRGGNVYEMPRNQIDLTLTKRLGKYVELRLGIQDLLNQRVQYIQDANADGKVKRQKSEYIPRNGYKGKDVEFWGFNRGSYYTAGLIIRFAE